MTENQKKFFEIMKDDSCGIFPCPTDAQLALNVIADYVLGPDWYYVDPISTAQINTVMVDHILQEVSKKYRRDKREN